MCVICNMYAKLAPEMSKFPNFWCNLNPLRDTLLTEMKIIKGFRKFYSLLCSKYENLPAPICIKTGLFLCLNLCPQYLYFRHFLLKCAIEFESESWGGFKR